MGLSSRWKSGKRGDIRKVQGMKWGSLMTGELKKKSGMRGSEGEKIRGKYKVGKEGILGIRR